MTESTIRELLKNNQYINWENISFDEVLSEEFIIKYADQLNWCGISSNQSLSYNFIKKFSDTICWQCISNHKKLSKLIIKEFCNEIYADWNYITFPLCYFKNINLENNWKTFL